MFGGAIAYVTTHWHEYNAKTLEKRTNELVKKFEQKYESKHSNDEHYYTVFDREQTFEHKNDVMARYLCLYNRNKFHFCYVKISNKLRNLYHNTNKILNDESEYIIEDIDWDDF